MSSAVVAVRLLVARAGQLDRLTALLAGAILAGALLWPWQTLASLRFAADSFRSIAPYLALSVALAAYARVAGADRLIGRVFRGRMPVMILAAAGFGALSPFCGCGVIPVIAGLLAAGVPLPPVMAFWLASPVTDPEMFVLTAAALGPGFAVAKTLAAAWLGLLGGVATLAAQRLGALGEGLRPELQARRSACGGLPAGRPDWAVWRDRRGRAAFAAEAGSAGLFLGRWLLLAFLLESLMLRFVPADAVAALLGGDGPLAVLIAVTVGAPLYLNGYAAIPLAAGLLQLGVSPGAVLGFMTAGGVTSIPAAIAVYALVRRAVFAAYLALAVAGSAAAGIAWQLAAA